MNVSSCYEAFGFKGFQMWWIIRVGRVDKSAIICNIFNVVFILWLFKMFLLHFIYFDEFLIN